MSSTQQRRPKVARDKLAKPGTDALKPSASLHHPATEDDPLRREHAHDAEDPAFARTAACQSGASDPLQPHDRFGSGASPRCATLMAKKRARVARDYPGPGDRVPPKSGRPTVPGLAPPTLPQSRNTGRLGRQIREPTRSCSASATG